MTDRSGPADPNYDRPVDAFPTHYLAAGYAPDERAVGDGAEGPYDYEDRALLELWDTAVCGLRWLWAWWGPVLLLGLVMAVAVCL